MTSLPIKLSGKDAALWILITALYLTLGGHFLFQPNAIPAHDNASFSFPLFHFVNESIGKNQAFPFWFPHANFGLPTLIYLNHQFLLLPTRLPFYLLSYFTGGSWDSLTLYKYNLLFTNLVFTFGFFLLLREFLFNRRMLYWATPLALFGGLTTCAFGQEQLMASLFFIPFIGICLIRAYRTLNGHYFLLSGLFIGQGLINHYPHQLTYFLIITFAALCFTHPKVLQRIWKQRNLWMRKLVFFTFPSIAFFSTITTTNYTEYYDRFYSPTRSETGNLKTDYSSIENRIGASLPFYALSYYLNPQDIAVRDVTRLLHFDRLPYYMGILPLFFAILAVFFVHNRLKYFCLLHFFLTLCFAIGKNGFVYEWLYQYIPFTTLERNPIHMGNYLNLSLIILSCLGMNSLVHLRLRSNKRTLLFAIITLITSTDLLLYFRMASRLGFPVNRISHEIGNRYLSENYVWFKDTYLRSRRSAYIRPNTLQLLKQQNISIPTANLRSPFGIQSVNYRGDHLSLLIQNAIPDVLQWDINYDKHWKATLNGHPAPLQNADGFIQIALPKGKSVLHIKYEPTSRRILLYLFMIMIPVAFVSLFPFSKKITKRTT